MKLTSICVLYLLIFFSCKNTTESPESIINKSIEAHGGLSVWNELQSLDYEKKTTLFDQGGNIESSTTQSHSYLLRPSFSASIKWNEDSITQEIIYKNDTVTKFKNGSKILDQSILKSAFNSVKSAQYVVSQPFKLLDSGIILTHEGRDKLEDDTEVDVIRAEYSKESINHTKSDTWWYYFDTNTALCVGNMVKHGNTYSYIKNLEYDRTSSIVFNHHRKSYRVDKDRNIQFLRAEYFYTNYRIK